MDNLHYFEEITVPDQPPLLILLDIDGTILPDTEEDASIENTVREKAALLSGHHSIYLCTNGRDRDRAKRIASKLGVALIDSKHKKYSQKILGDLPLGGNRQVLVIGDKILTDGWLARKIDAELYLVKRKCSGKERTLVRLGNFLNDAVTVILS